MVFQFSSWRQCSTKSMFYMLFSISLCAILHVWMLQHILSFVDNVNVMMSNAKLVYRKIHSQPTPTTATAPKKYILLWDKIHQFVNETGESIFPTLNCEVKNCLFTVNRNLTNFTRFDAVLFSEEILYTEKRPMERSPSQLFVFATVESSNKRAACEVYNDNFFNWTFTYRLDSDVLWTYFVVRNASGAIVAPSTDVTWTKSAKPLKPELKSILHKKRKAAAWLVSHCEAESFRDDYLTRLQQHLYHYALRIDIYGLCSNVKCTNGSCDDMLTQNYRFYIAFENSFGEDYITETVLHGYRNYAIPIVLGGANYSRFLPPGSYINAREIHPYNLAYTIYEATKKPAVFESYFKWTNDYSIEETDAGYHPLCSMCAALNDESAARAPAKKNFRVWWNTLNGMKRCLPDAYWSENAVLINLDESQNAYNINQY